MTTLAGQKIRDFRERQSPKLTRAEFGQRFGGAHFSTVEGWEVDGKVPRDRLVINQLAKAGIARHADWTTPATCPRCELRADTEAVADCTRQDCPLSHVEAA